MNLLFSQTHHPRVLSSKLRSFIPYAGFNTPKYSHIASESHGYSLKNLNQRDLPSSRFTIPLQLKSPTLNSSSQMVLNFEVLCFSSSVPHTAVPPGLSLGSDICVGPSFMVSLILTPPTQLHHIHVLRPQHTLIHCLPLLLDSKSTLVPEYLFFFFSGKELFLRYLFWKIAQVRKCSLVSGKTGSNSF